MIAAGTWVCCPACRLYADGLATETPPALKLPCPWCKLAAHDARAWARCAAETECGTCQHPKSLHTCYGTSDGEAPVPGQHVVSIPWPCSACGCKATHGENVVRANG